MEIALLILSCSLFIYLFYMFDRVLRAVNETFSEAQHTLEEMNKKLDAIEVTVKKHYRSYGE